MRAHDLLEQARVELVVGLVVVSEPYPLPERTFRVTNPDRQVAVMWELGRGAPLCTVAQHGRGWSAVTWGEFLVVGCYMAPRFTVPEFEDRLDEIGAFLEWGAPRTDSRGQELLEWAEALGFVLKNPHAVTTFRGSRSELTIDLICVNPAAAAVTSDCWVAEDTEPRADHMYVLLGTSATPASPRPLGPVDGPRVGSSGA